MKVFFYTFGCKVNQYETQVLKQQFKEKGFETTDIPQKADVLIINSCTVTHIGDKKTLQLFRRLKRINPKALFVLTGCLPQAFPEMQHMLPEADIITGTKERKDLISYVMKALEKRQSIREVSAYENQESFEPMQVKYYENRTRAFIKIEDGCDRFCHYCIIPKARGRVRSKSLDDLKREVCGLAENGHQEIVLVGINLSSYGKDLENVDLTDAVRETCAAPGVRRVRLGSLEPDLLTEDQLQKLVKLSGFCPQFHIALQSGCDATLHRMNRHYTAAQYWHLVSKIRTIFPNSAITTDIMVGFPGETEDEFLQTLDFVKKVQFAKAHIFPYSVRSGTKAANFSGQISQKEKKERVHRLSQICEEGKRAFYKKQLAYGTHEVLLEKTEGEFTFGYTENYTPVYVKDAVGKEGKIVAVRLIDEHLHGCVGKII